MSLCSQSTLTLMSAMKGLDTLEIVEIAIIYNIDAILRYRVFCRFWRNKERVLGGVRALRGYSVSKFDFIVI